MISSIFIVVWLDGAPDYCWVDCWCCVLLSPSKEIYGMGLPLCQFMKHPHTLRNLSFIMLSYLAFCLDSAPIRSIRKNNSECLFEIWLSKYNWFGRKNCTCTQIKYHIFRFSMNCKLISERHLLKMTSEYWHLPFPGFFINNLKFQVSFLYIKDGWDYRY